MQKANIRGETLPMAQNAREAQLSHVESSKLSEHLTEGHPDRSDWHAGLRRSAPHLLRRWLWR
jgi:hypothetical protein